MKVNTMANTCNEKLTYYCHKTFLHSIVLKQICIEFNSSYGMISSAYHKRTLSKCYFPLSIFRCVYIHRQNGRKYFKLNAATMKNSGWQILTQWATLYIIPFVHIVYLINFTSSYNMHKMNSLWEYYNLSIQLHDLCSYSKDFNKIWN
jgi:hypothetical protein